MAKRPVMCGPFAAPTQMIFPRHQLAPAALMLVSGIFTADATVGDRELCASVMDANGVEFAWCSLGVVTAGQTRYFVLADSCKSQPDYSLDTTDSVLGCVPCCGLWQGCTVRLYDWNGVSAGDAWSGCIMAVCLDD